MPNFDKRSGGVVLNSHLSVEKYLIPLFLVLFVYRAFDPWFFHDIVRLQSRYSLSGFLISFLVCVLVLDELRTNYDAAVSRLMHPGLGRFFLSVFFGLLFAKIEVYNAYLFPLSIMLVTLARDLTDLLEFEIFALYIASIGFFFVLLSFLPPIVSFKKMNERFKVALILMFVWLSGPLFTTNFFSGFGGELERMEVEIVSVSPLSYFEIPNEVNAKMETPTVDRSERSHIIVDVPALPGPAYLSIDYVSADKRDYDFNIVEYGGHGGPVFRSTIKVYPRTRVVIEARTDVIWCAPTDYPMRCPMANGKYNLLAKLYRNDDSLIGWPSGRENFVLSENKSEAFELVGDVSEHVEEMLFDRLATYGREFFLKKNGFTPNLIAGNAREDKALIRRDDETLCGVYEFGYPFHGSITSCVSNKGVNGKSEIFDMNQANIVMSDLGSRDGFLHMELIKPSVMDILGIDEVGFDGMSLGIKFPELVEIDGNNYLESYVSTDEYTPAIGGWFSSKIIFDSDGNVCVFSPEDRSQYSEKTKCITEPIWK